MKPLSVADLMKLEDYAGERPAFRKRVLEHKKNRKLHIGAHLTLLFEDRLTIQYQVQEMLRIERIFERAAIEEELGAYNPLIPDGGNWKATCLIEYEDPVERAQHLAKLKGIEDLIWAQVGEGPRISAIAGRGASLWVAALWRWSGESRGCKRKPSLGADRYSHNTCLPRVGDFR